MSEDPIIALTKVQRNGVVQIPKEIRDKFKLEEGTRLMVVAAEDSVILQKVDAIVEKGKLKEILNKMKGILAKLKL